MSTLDRSLSRQSMEHILQSLAKHGHSGLGASVVLRAVIDWRYGGSEARRFVKLNGFASPQGELLEFWDSDWGRYLRGHYGLDESLEDLGLVKEEYAAESV